MLGTVLQNRYEIKSLLGEGSAALVYLAFDRESKQQVAIKQLKKITISIQEQELLTKRFLREANIQQSIKHPSILYVQDVLQDDGCFFLVMEFIDGEPLKSHFAKEENRRLEHVLPLFIQLLQGLEEAHKHGVIHRDIKPSNILITKSGQLKIADFGIAKALNDPRLTQTGLMLGTPLYMSPEQCRGDKELTFSSDLYSVGIALFEAFVGHPPFRVRNASASHYQILQQHLFDPPPKLSRLRPDLPPIISEIIERALAKQPQERFSSTAEFREILEQTLNRPFERIPPQQKKTIEDVFVPSPFARDVSTNPLFQRPSSLASTPKKTTASFERNGLSDFAKAIQETNQRKEPQPSQSVSSDMPDTRQLERFPRRRPIWQVFFFLLLLLFVGVGIMKLNSLRSSKKQSKEKVVPFFSGTNWQQDASETPEPKIKEQPPLKLPSHKEDMVFVKENETYLGNGEPKKWVRSLYGRRRKKNDNPFRVVKLQSFWIDRYEVKVADYEKCVRKGSCTKVIMTKRDLPGLRTAKVSLSRYLPSNLSMPAVTWKQAKDFCHFKKKRLPTSEEWEYAATGPFIITYSWGDSPPRCDLLSMRGCQALIHGMSYAIKPKAKSYFGTYDMLGNLWEWTSSCATKTKKGQCKRAILRGGSFKFGRKSPGFRLHYKHSLSVGLQRKDVGFRCAMNAEKDS